MKTLKRIFWLGLLAAIIIWGMAIYDVFFRKFAPIPVGERIIGQDQPMTNSPDGVSQRCHSCQGKGTMKCRKCAGSGTVEASTTIACRECGGSGRQFSKLTRKTTICPYCNTTGRITVRNRVNCPGCGGTASVQCDKCQGQGTIQNNR